MVCLTLLNRDNWHLISYIFALSVPDEGYSKNASCAPDEGYSKNASCAPDEGYSKNASCALNLISTF